LDALRRPLLGDRLEPGADLRMWGSSIAAAWNLWNEPVRKLRELEGRTGVYAYFEDLAREMRKQIAANERVNEDAGRAVT
jgi:hypothetical protein